MNKQERIKYLKNSLASIGLPNAQFKKETFQVIYFTLRNQSVTLDLKIIKSDYDCYGRITDSHRWIKIDNFAEKKFTYQEIY